jgi:hypothetical protein
MQASIDEQKGTPWEGVTLPYDGSINRITGGIRAHDRASSRLVQYCMV